MGRARHSKRLARELPEGELPAKRVRKPTTYSLAAFDAKQGPSKASNRSIGRRKARSLAPACSSPLLLPRTA